MMSMWGILLRQIIPKHGRIFYNPMQQEHVQEKIASATQELEQIRLLVLGDAGVGKSSLVKSLTSGKYVVNKTHGVESVLVDNKWKKADESQTSFDMVCGLFAAKETISCIKQKRLERRPTAHTQYRQLLRHTSQEADKLLESTDSQKAVMFLVVMCLISACAGVLRVVYAELLLFVLLEIFNTYNGGANFQNWRFILLGLICGYSFGASFHSWDFSAKQLFPLWFHDAALALILLLFLDVMLYFSVWLYKSGRTGYKFCSFIDNVNILPFYNSFAHFVISGTVIGLENNNLYVSQNDIWSFISLICYVVVILHIGTWKQENKTSFNLWKLPLFFTPLTFIVYSHDNPACYFVFCIVDFGIHCYQNHKKKKSIVTDKDKSEVQTRKFLQDKSELDRASEMISCLKIDIYDFAGDEDYYAFHQVFISDNAFYVVVFNLVSFIDNPDCEVKRIYFWLESVLSKASPVNRINSVFLVGSHCGNISDNELREVDVKLHQDLWDPFQECFVCNEVDELMFFPIENVNSDPDNSRITCLRNNIVKTIGNDCVEYVKDNVPLSWFKVKDAILQHRQQESQSQKSVLTRAEFDIFVESALRASVDSQESEKILKYFNSKGLVMLLTDPNQQFQAIVIDPQHLIAVIIKIVEPVISGYNGAQNQNGALRRHYAFLAKYGLLTKQLLEHVLPDENAYEYKSLLEAYDLIFPVNKQQLFVQLDPAEHLQFSHMVPSKLPESQAGRTITPSVDAERFFIQFHTFLPQPLFYKVVCQCYQHSQTIYPMCRPALLRHKALLYASTKQSYMIILDKKQQRIEVAFTREDKDLVFMMGFIFHIVDRIRKREYPNLVCHCGPLCPLVKNQSCLGDYKVQGKQHVIDIFPRCQSTVGGLLAIHCGMDNLTEQLKLWIPQQ